MKVRCIYKNNYINLTVGKIYEVERTMEIEDGTKFYKIKKDNKQEEYIEANLFAIIEEKDNVNHPSHYNYKSMECKDIIQVMCEGIEEGQAYKLGCAIKYLYRYPKKGKAVEDLEKAKAYINMIIEELEAEK